MLEEGNKSSLKWKLTRIRMRMSMQRERYDLLLGRKEMKVDYISLYVNGSMMSVMEYNRSRMRKSMMEMANDDVSLRCWDDMRYREAGCWDA